MPYFAPPPDIFASTHALFADPDSDELPQNSDSPDATAMEHLQATNSPHAFAGSEEPSQHSDSPGAADISPGAASMELIQATNIPHVAVQELPQAAVSSSSALVLGGLASADHRKRSNASLDAAENTESSEHRAYRYATKVRLVSVDNPDLKRTIKKLRDRVQSERTRADILNAQLQEAQQGRVQTAWNTRGAYEGIHAEMERLSSELLQATQARDTATGLLGQVERLLSDLSPNIEEGSLSLPSAPTASHAAAMLEILEGLIQQASHFDEASREATERQQQFQITTEARLAEERNGYAAQMEIQRQQHLVDIQEAVHQARAQERQGIEAQQQRLLEMEQQQGREAQAMRFYLLSALSHFLFNLQDRQELEAHREQDRINMDALHVELDRYRRRIQELEQAQIKAVEENQYLTEAARRSDEAYENVFQFNADLQAQLEERKQNVAQEAPRAESFNPNGGFDISPGQTQSGRPGGQQTLDPKLSARRREKLPSDPRLARIREMEMLSNRSPTRYSSPASQEPLEETISPLQHPLRLYSTSHRVSHTHNTPLHPPPSHHQSLVAKQTPLGAATPHRVRFSNEFEARMPETQQGSEEPSPVEFDNLPPQFLSLLAGIQESSDSFKEQMKEEMADLKEAILNMKSPSTAATPANEAGSARRVRGSPFKAPASERRLRGAIRNNMMVRLFSSIFSPSPSDASRPTQSLSRNAIKKKLSIKVDADIHQAT
ncbi:hypothetical protein H0H92_000305 [Tricholoma furcatifolium]|nr:hypothetical protein H0H92_000305 [Tricholoma furcatifolium]